MLTGFKVEFIFHFPFGSMLNYMLFSVYLFTMFYYKHIYVYIVSN
jgi:hypothetical protein